jgi:hypothetical protein
VNTTTTNPLDVMWIKTSTAPNAATTGWERAITEVAGTAAPINWHLAGWRPSAQHKLSAAGGFVRLDLHDVRERRELGKRTARSHLDFAALIALVGTSAFAQIEPPSLTTGSFDFRYCRLAGCTLTGTLLLPDGSTGAPSIAWAADADGSGTGFYRGAANNIYVVGNGTASMRLNAGGILPVTTNAIDLGTSLLQWRTLYLSGSLQGGSTKTLAETSATGFVTITVPNSGGCAGKVAYTVFAADATNTQIKSGELHFSAVANSSGTVTAASVSDVNTLNPVSSGTLTNTMTSTTAANATTLLANATSSLTQTTLEIRYRVELHGGTCTVTGL